MVSDRQVYPASSEGEDSTALNSYQTKVTLQFTPDANSTYLILTTCLGRCNQTSGTQVKVRLYNNTSSTTLIEQFYLSKDVNDYLHLGGAVYETFGASPTEQTYYLQYCLTNTGSGYTAYAKMARVVAIKLTSSDKSASQTDRVTYNTDTTYQNRVTLTFTPATQGDYLLIGSATLDGSSSSYDSRVRINRDTMETFGTQNIETTATANRYPYLYFQKVNLTAASHSIYLQYSTENTSNTIGITYAYMIALRLDEFYSIYSAEQNTEQSASSETNVLSLDTSSAKNIDHIILFSALITSKNVNQFVNCGLHEYSDTDLGYGALEIKDTSNYHTGFGIYHTATPSINSAGYQCKLGSTNGTGYADDIRLYAFQLKAATTYKTLSATSQPAATITTKLTFSRALSASSSGSTSLKRGFYLTLAGSSVGTALLTKVFVFTRLLEASSTGSVILTKVATFPRTLESSSDGTAELTKLGTFYRTLESSSQGTATLLYGRVISKLLEATGTGVATLTKGFTITLSAIANGVGTLGKVATMYIVLPASSAGSAILSRIGTFSRSLEATSTGVGTLEKPATFYRALSTTTTGVTILTKVTTFYRALVSTSQGIATLIAEKLGGVTNYVTLTAISTGVATLTFVRKYTVDLIVVTTGVVTLTSLKTFYRSLTSSSGGVATLSKVSTFYRTLSSVSQGVAVVSRVVTFFRVLTSTVVGVVDLVAQKIAPVYYITLAATTTGVASISTTFIEFVVYVARSFITKVVKELSLITKTDEQVSEVDSEESRVNATITKVVKRDSYIEK